MNEVNNNTTDVTDEDELDELKPIEEGDPDAKWLEEVGLEEIVQNFRNGEVIDDDVIIKHTATFTRRQAMSVIKRVNTLNDTIRRKRTNHGTNNNINNDNLNVRQYAPIPNSAIPPEQQQKYQQQQSQYLRTNQDLQQPSRTPQQFYNNDNNNNNVSSKISAISDDSQIKLLSYKGIDTQLKNDEIRLKEVKIEKTDGFEDFKTYVLENKSRVGITNINDMSSTDIENMHNLALLNLTALFDENDLNFLRKKSKQKKSKDSGVFGVSLNSLLENDRKRSIRNRVPYLFKKIIDILRIYGLRTEGILRVPGSSVRVKNVINELNNSYTNDAIWSELTVNDVSNLLKIFLRELPQPLLTYEYYQSFTQILYLNDIHDKIYGFMNLILLLPTAHRDTLKMLLEFLYELVENCEYNKMNLTSVAVIMAPNLFLSTLSNKKYPVLNASEKSVNDQMIDVVKHLIKYHELIWLIPNDLIKQFRLLNEQKAKKSKPVFIAKLLNLRNTSNNSNKRKDELFNGNIENIDFLVNIKVGNYPTFDSLTAGELVQMVLRENFKEYKDIKTILSEISSSQNSYYFTNGTNGYRTNEKLIPKDGLYLFEQDGNLISRRIDHFVRIKDIKEENPNATWSVRYWSFSRA